MSTMKKMPRIIAKIVTLTTTIIVYTCKEKDAIFNITQYYCQPSKVIPTIVAT